MPRFSFSFIVFFSLFIFFFLAPLLLFAPLLSGRAFPCCFLFPFRQAVGINGNVNTARYRGNFTKKKEKKRVFGPGAGEVGRCWRSPGRGEKLGATRRRPLGCPGVAQVVPCVRPAPVGLRLCKPWDGRKNPPQHPWDPPGSPLGPPAVCTERAFNGAAARCGELGESWEKGGVSVCVGGVREEHAPPGGTKLLLLGGGQL